MQVHRLKLLLKIIPILNNSISLKCPTAASQEMDDLFDVLIESGGE